MSLRGREIEIASDEGEERKGDSRTEWIQEHQAGVLECSRYLTYTYALRPHQPLLVGSVLVIGKSSATTKSRGTRDQSARRHY